MPELHPDLHDTQEVPDYVDVLESRIVLSHPAGTRAKAWAQCIRDNEHLSTEFLGRLVQALITDETNRVLLFVEKAILQEIK